MKLTGIVFLSCAVIAAGAQAPSLSLSGSIADRSGAAVPNGAATLRLVSTGSQWTSRADPEGRFRFEGLATGRYELVVTAPGFGPWTANVDLDQDASAIELQLEPATVVQEIRVTAGRVAGSPETLSRLPGSVEFLDASTLAASRVLSTDEALRKISGVHARGEDGLGLRPNIGVRGLLPTRSTKVLLLEDGIPVSYAPYGDNASYYHPPIDRFETVEVVKGAGQIVYGPMTVGGVVNYVTPPVPSRRGGSATVVGGNRDYLNGHVRYGAPIGRTGVLLDFMRKQGEGVRGNQRHGMSDANAKTLTALTGHQTLGIRFNSYEEDSNLTYSGLRQDEFAADPRGNPFRNDFLRIHRFGASVSHNWAPSPDAILATNAYASVFLRDWWRQSSNSSQRPNDSADPGCGGMANVNTSCGNEGRLRSYYTWGIEPKLRASHRLFGAQSELDLGVRFHSERQERLQKNGPLPTSRDGALVEDNARIARAFSAFFQNRLGAGGWSLTPGLRMEHVRYRRTNFLAKAGKGVSGATAFTKLIPGIGLSYSRGDRVTVFSGVHRGFAPPRVEDVINNSTGASIELDSESSWNFELGARARPARDAQIEAAFFRMDFSNQIVPASVAGGVGATLTNAGRTLHQGAELSGRFALRGLLPPRHTLSLRSAYTWVPVARYTGNRLSAVPGYGAARITGHRLPYAPEHLLTSSLAYMHGYGVNAMLECVYTGLQFGDDLNVRGGTADGQRGALPGNAIWNASLNVPLETRKTTIFFAVKNLGDRMVIADRSRGIIPGLPRLFQLGLRFAF
ncbi:MAG TPA: TonB-dependent receptor [Bryobacteraceae bacterium]|nr:TonB-dependent receptor [Bryobacteraceae bacterium]